MSDDDDRGKRSIDYRDPRLVIAILGVIYEADEDVDPFDLKMIFAGDLWRPDTVERTIGDLVSFGAVRRIKPKTGGPRARSRLRMTDLGRAWVDRRVEPYVRGSDEPDRARNVFLGLDADEWAEGDGLPCSPMVDGRRLELEDVKAAVSAMLRRLDAELDPD